MAVDEPAGTERLTVDPDVVAVADTSSPRRRRHAAVVVAVGVGGAIGSVARYGLASAFPATIDEFPWATLAINLSGSFLLGVVVYILFERRLASRLLRPFFAVGVLGGFTTFSTFMVEVVQRVADRPQVAAAYLAVSVACGPLALLAGGAAIRWIYSVSSGERRKGA